MLMLVLALGLSLGPAPELVTGDCIRPGGHGGFVDVS